MEINELKRAFKYNGVALDDPNQKFSLVQVRDFFAAVYPEIISADIEGPDQVGNTQIYTFKRAVGTKGASRPQHIEGGMTPSQLDRLDQIATVLIERGWNDTGVLSGGEAVYVLLAASRVDLLVKRSYTIPSAIARLGGPDLANLCARWQFNRYTPNQKADKRPAPRNDEQDCE